MNKIFYHKQTLIFLALFVIFLASAIIVGISDNPPGILLAYLSSIMLVIAFTNNWRDQKNFVMLMLISFAAFLILAFLHNIFESLGKGNILGVIGAIFFIAAIFICPAGVLVGIIGSLATTKKNNLTKIGT